MPTGYTADIPNGITFQAFAMNCARAFGACVMIRDQPGGGEAIPEEFKPDPYYRQRVGELTRELAEVRALSADGATEAAKIERIDSLREYEQRIARTKEQREAYESMLAKVQEWEPPTDEHVPMKAFMLDQIKQSIKFDCTPYDFDQPGAERSGEEWREDRIGNLERDLKRAEKAYSEEAQRASDRTDWVRALRESLSDSNSTAAQS